MEFIDFMIAVCFVMLISNIVLWVTVINIGTWQQEADVELDMLHEIMRNHEVKINKMK